MIHTKQVIRPVKMIINIRTSLCPMVIELSLLTTLVLSGILFSNQLHIHALSDCIINGDIEKIIDCQHRHGAFTPQNWTCRGVRSGNVHIGVGNYYRYYEILLPWNAWSVRETARNLADFSVGHS